MHDFLATRFDDENCRATEVCAELDFVGAGLCVEALLCDSLAECVHERCCAVRGFAGGEGCADNSRLHVYAEASRLGDAWHANAALCICAPVTRCVRLDEFALGGAFEFGLFGIEILERVCGAVSFPEE